MPTSVILVLVDKTVYRKDGDYLMNLSLLAKKIDDSGLTKTAIAEGLGLTRQGLYNKLEGKNEFTGSELKRLSTLLSLNEQDKNDIFFADYVDQSAN